MERVSETMEVDEEFTQTKDKIRDRVFELMMGNEKVECSYHDSSVVVCLLFVRSL